MGLRKLPIYVPIKNHIKLDSYCKRPVYTGFSRRRRLELLYYQQPQTPPPLKSAQEKGLRARGGEDKGLVSVLEPESIA
jgi:hypothetical protein